MIACPTGQPSPQEAATAGWSNRHVSCFQIRGDVSPGDLRLCIRDRQGLHHSPDQRHGDDHPPSAEVPAGSPSSSAVPQKGLQDLRGVQLVSCATKCVQKCFSVFNLSLPQVTAEQHTLAKYLLELTMVDYEMVHLPPSMVASAALALTLKVLDAGEWVSEKDVQTKCIYLDFNFHNASSFKA